MEARERLSSDLGAADAENVRTYRGVSSLSEASVSHPSPRASTAPTAADGGLLASTQPAEGPLQPTSSSIREERRSSRQSTPGSSSTRYSAATVRARKLAIQALHARKLAERDDERERQAAEREKRVAEREKRVAELELEAELAAVDAEQGNASSVRSRTSIAHTMDWVTRSHTYAHSSCSNHDFENNDIERYSQLEMNLDQPLDHSYAVPHTQSKMSNFMPVTAQHIIVDCTALEQNQQLSSAERNRDAVIRPHALQVLVPTLSHGAPVTTRAAAADIQMAASVVCEVPGNIGKVVPLNSNIESSSDIGRLAAAITALATKSSVESRPGSRKPWYIELPAYYGHPTQWLAFKRTFEDTKASYTVIENLARLRHAVRGDAREAVASLLVSAEDPLEVLQALELRFARPEYIVMQEIAAIRALPKLQENNMNVFACRIRNCVETIRLLKKDEYLHSPELFDSLITKLSPWMQARWRDYAREKPDQVKLILLSEFMNREAESQVKWGQINMINSEQAAAAAARREREPREKMHIHTTVASSSSQPTECCYCKESHNINVCQKFKSLDVDGRWRWVRETRVCYRCLKATAHQWKTCRVRPCDHDGCQFRHHSLLHGGSLPSTGAQSPRKPNRSTYYTVEEPQEPSCSLNKYGEKHSTLDKENGHLGSNIKESGHSSVIKNCDTDKVLVSNIHVEYSQIHNSLSRRTLLKVIPVVVSGPAGEVETYALLDDGSSATLIDSDIASRIGAKGPSMEIQVQGVKGMTTETSVQLVNFHIRGQKTNEIYFVEQARAVPDLGLTRQSVSSIDIAKYAHLADLVDELSYEEAVPTILIGSPDALLTLSRNTRSSSKNEPVACRTLLGWVVHGSQCGKTKEVQFVNNIMKDNIHFIVETDTEDLNRIIQEQYNLDCIGINKCESYGVDNNRALEILDKTSRRLPNGRFEVGLLWRSDNPQLPDSYFQARRRLEMLEKKLAKDPKLKKLYNENMQSMIDKDYAEECTGKTSLNPQWYLPHFGVINQNKPDKLRIVHDAAAKSQGVSLNSSLLPGPDMLQSLLGVLFRFREKRIAMTADIQEMFPQIKIREEDRNAQRYLWRENEHDDIREFRMNSMIFGATSSPCTAHYIKNKNAMEFKNEYPNAVNAIIRDHYMDDYIGSVDNLNLASQLASDIITIHRKAGFVMRGWISNEPLVIASIPAELRHTQTTSIGLGTLPTSVRTLGLIWSPVQDTLGFQTGLDDKIPKILSKRMVLSHLMRIYDPLGLLTPLVMRGRILFQQTWRSGIGWDAELQTGEREQWHGWLSELCTVSNIQLNRWYLHDNNFLECELHLFSDASELAYACVAYWRFIYSDGRVKLALIGSKARVTPLKPSTIPRLELQGALIASRLANTICNEHTIKPNRLFFWTDSMTVLGWLRSDARTFKAFVGHRVGEICETTRVTDWKWVPSALNVADDATRVKSERLKPDNRWFVGPEFLLKSQETWPTEPSKSKFLNHDNETKMKLLDINCTEVHSLCAPVSAEATRFSSWIRLLRATAYAHKYVAVLRERVLAKINQNLRADRAFEPLPLSRESMSVPAPATFGATSALCEPHRPNISSRPRPSLNGTCIPLTAEDIYSAALHVLRSSQASTFGDEIACIRMGQEIRKGRLTNLSLMIDENDILRLSGRIKVTNDIPYDTKNPILLDGRHPATRLLVQQMHRQYAHANNESVINEIRQTYWILRLRNTVKTVARECQLCKLRRATPLNPSIGDLPIDRLAHHRRPFTYTGIDYFGPVEVTLLRRHMKRWVALYTCMTTRAVHLEVVTNLTTDSTIMSLRRFIARRGKPHKILSDNATTFVGAKNLLVKLYGEALIDYAANKGIIWSFIPPSAPSMGGAWERLVRSVKTALKVTLHERAPKEEVLHTLLLEAEAIVNSRPLTHVSVDDTDPEALTPFHFLLGSSSTATSHIKLDDGDLIRRCDYLKALRLADHFWTRWVKEYLPTLLPRRASGQPTENLSIGDLVIIVDGNLPRGTWPRGRIAAVFPGQDGVVRVADVTTSGGLLRRPVRKLVRLPVDPNKAE